MPHPFSACKLKKDRDCSMLWIQCICSFKATYFKNLNIIPMTYLHVVSHTALLREEWKKRKLAWYWLSSLLIPNLLYFFFSFWVYENKERSKITVLYVRLHVIFEMCCTLLLPEDTKRRLTNEDRKDNWLESIARGAR